MLTVLVGSKVLRPTAAEQGKRMTHSDRVHFHLELEQSGLSMCGEKFKISQ